MKPPKAEQKRYKMKTLIKNIAFVLTLFMFTLISTSCRKGEEQTIAAADTLTFTLGSAAVENGLLLDAYKCEPKVNGTESSIPLSWSNAPAGTSSFAITMVHYPNPNDSVHRSSYLLLWGIDKSVTGIPYGQADKGPWFMGANKDTVAVSYTSPCSPSSGAHQYILTIYALSATPPGLPTQNSLGVTYGVLMNALSAVTIIDKATLVFNNVTP